MIKHHLRELTKSFGSQIDSQKSEQLRRTKTDIENSLTRISKLIQNEDQSKKNGNPVTETELVRLIEDFHNQYESLYALYGPIAGEYVKWVPHRIRRMSSVSSTSSDSNYFSSEEGDINCLRSPVENCRSIIHQVVKARTASHEAKQRELEEKLRLRMKDLDSLNHQKRSLELQVESQAHQVLHLSEKNAKLLARVFELQLLLKTTEGAVSILQTKLKNNEDKALSRNNELVARINRLEQEAKSLRSHKGKMEEKIKRCRSEALSQKKDFTEQLNVMQHQFDSARSRNKELETELVTERKKVSQKKVERNAVIKERECLLARILELESQCSKQNGLEEQVRGMSHEITRLTEEKKALQDKNLELESEMKNKLELQNERKRKEYSESIAELEAQVAEQEEIIKKQAGTIDQMREENKEAETWSKRLKLTQQLAERKIEELEVEFRKKMEDNTRLLNQRIHVAEQLNKENKDSWKRTKQRYEQENELLGEKVASYENELRTLKVKESPSPLVNDLNCLELATIKGLELDFAAGKLEEHREVQCAKEWIAKRNEEMKQVKDNVDRLTSLLGEKEKQELLLREKVWELEANVSEEGKEKLNLMKAVSELERKVVRLEKDLKEKDEELVALGEKKREAIRQLCLLIEFHRQRYCDRLKVLVTETRATSKKRVLNFLPS